MLFFSMKGCLKTNKQTKPGKIIQKCQVNVFIKNKYKNVGAFIHSTVDHEQ